MLCCVEGPFRPWVIDLLGIALVDIARSDWAVLANDVVDDALVGVSESRLFCLIWARDGRGPRYLGDVRGWARSGDRDHV